MNPKVYITPIETDHIQKYIHYSKDPELISTMGWKPFKSHQKQQFIKAVTKPSLPLFRSEEYIIFSIVAVNNNIPIGFISLKGIDWESEKAELAIAICDSQYRSGGYGSEALALGIDHAFNSLKLISIYLSVFPSNRRAIRVYEKIGFNLVERLEKSWTMPDGEKVDMLIMVIEKKDSGHLSYTKNFHR